MIVFAFASAATIWHGFGRVRTSGGHTADAAGALREESVAFQLCVPGGTLRRRLANIPGAELTNQTNSE